MTRAPITLQRFPGAPKVGAATEGGNGLRNRLLTRRDRHKNSVTDPRESDQGQKKREKKNRLFKVVRQPEHMEHEAQRRNVQNKSKQRHIGPDPVDNPQHEQNQNETRGQGQAPNYLEKKIIHDLERITSGESMLEKKRRRAGNQVGRRKQQRRDVNKTFHLRFIGGSIYRKPLTMDEMNSRSSVACRLRKL